MAATDPRRRFPVVLTIAAAVAFAILCGLGTWQWQRLQWKRDLIERIAEGQARPPAPLADVLSRADAGEDVEFTRVAVDCLQPAFSAPTVYLLSPRAGRIVWRPITPCRIDAAGFTVIAVDRGAADLETMEAPELALPPVRHVTGVLRRPAARTFMQRIHTYAENDQIGYQHRDSALAAVRRNTGAKAPDYMLVAEREAPPPPGVTPAPLPTAISNRHLEYVITWFGLAAALAAVYAAMLMKRLKR